MIIGSSKGAIVVQDYINDRGIYKMYNTESDVFSVDIDNYQVNKQFIEHAIVIIINC